VAANWDKQAQLGVTHNISCGGEDPLNYWPRRRRLQMGNQKAHRREARKAKEETRNFSSLPELGTAVKNGEVKLLPEVSPTPAPVVTTVPTTKAGVSEYNDFFGLYAKSVRENRPFRPLGFIPGPAVILEFREGGEARVFAATSDVAKAIGGTIPTPWVAWDKLPEKIRKALAEQKAVVDGLGYEPSPYNLGLAKALLDGRAPTKYLAAVMPRFRYRGGDPELPFGVALLSVLEGGVLKGLKVKTYNPRGIPDVPADGVILALDELKNGRGPIQKLLRTWALMETNFLSRYDRDGNRRQNSQPRPRLT